MGLYHKGLATGSEAISSTAHSAHIPVECLYKNHGAEKVYVAIVGRGKRKNSVDNDSVETNGVSTGASQKT